MRYLKKFGFLKGLAEGLHIDGKTPESRVILSMIDLFEEMTDALSEMKNAQDAQRQDFIHIKQDMERLGRSVDELDEFLKAFSKNFSHILDSLPDDKPVSHEDEETFYEVKCPQCGEEITLNEDMLGQGSIRCPKCKGLLEFDLDGQEPEGDHEHT